MKRDQLMACPMCGGAMEIKSKLHGVWHVHLGCMRCGSLFDVTNLTRTREPAGKGFENVSMTVDLISIYG